MLLVIIYVQGRYYSSLDMGFSRDMLIETRLIASKNRVLKIVAIIRYTARDSGHYHTSRPVFLHQSFYL